MPGFLLFLTLLLLPFLLLDVVMTALPKLGIDPALAPMLLTGMLLGSMLNIPVFREPARDSVSHHPLDVWRLGGYWPQLRQSREEKIIAINVGGFLIPMLLVLYEFWLLARFRPDALGPLLACVLINIAVCHATARPVNNLGIVMPALLPGAVAALSALFLAPSIAPPVAFCAGVLGPVIGADLMNLGKIRRMSVGMASIGGAGTFDGIVISGLLAVLLA